MTVAKIDPKENSDFYKINIFDVILIVFVLFSCISILLFTKMGLNWQLSEVSEAAVYHEGGFLRSLTLNKDQNIDLLDGKIILEVREGRIRVKKSDCPRRICVHVGWIKVPGQIIACVPNKILIEIRSADSPGIDAVAY